jgi:hypothetical protein
LVSPSRTSLHLDIGRVATSLAQAAPSVYTVPTHVIEEWS